MTALRATATLTALLLLAGLGYAASCTWWPFAPCWCCHGTGRHTRRDGRVFRDCRWCAGKGRRLRLGRRAYNTARRHRKAARG